MYADLKSRLSESIQAMKEDRLKTKHLSIGDWEGFQKEFIAVVDKGRQLIDRNLQSFRGLSIGVWDEPRITIRNFHIDN
jgi:hypothetical protein